MDRWRDACAVIVRSVYRVREQRNQECSYTYLNDDIELFMMVDAPCQAMAMLFLVKRSAYLFMMLLKYLVVK